MIMAVSLRLVYLIFDRLLDDEIAATLLKAAFTIADGEEIVVDV
jgi:hypothetical protein